jgi:hypothetical protein
MVALADRRYFDDIVYRHAGGVMGFPYLVSALGFGNAVGKSLFYTVVNMHCLYPNVFGCVLVFAERMLGFLVGIDPRVFDRVNSQKLRHINHHLPECQYG